MPNSEVKNILVVDDEAKITRVQTSLSSQGYSTRTAADW